MTTVCPGLMRTGSHVNARFKGKRQEEFAWFAVSDSLPVTSMAGRRAACRILEACRYGEPSLTLTPQAKANWARLRDRYVGNISGESLGHYVTYDPKALEARLKAAKNREEAITAKV